MLDGYLLVLTMLVAIGCGIVGGVFFGFSTFVMKALARLPAAQGLAAMQSINVAAVNPLFMLALVGTAIASAVLAVLALVKLDEPFASYLLVGSVVYLGGSFVLTVAYHVPRNEALRDVVPGGGDAVARWERYVRDWTTWNHVRAAASLAAAVTLTLALRAG